MNLFRKMILLILFSRLFYNSISIGRLSCRKRVNKMYEVHTYYTKYDTLNLF